MASNLIAQEANPDANIIWGVAFDNELDDEMRITIIATGFEKKPEDAQRDVARKTNSGLFNKDNVVKTATAAEAAPAPADKSAARPASAPVKKVVKPAPKPAAKEDDDFDDLFDMIRKK